jgi:LysM repeat protein
MKVRTIALLAVLAVMVVIISSAAVEETAAQTQGTENLLRNSGFEEGHYNQNMVAELTVPNEWKLHFVDGVTFPGAWDNLPAARPESVVWNSIGGVPEGEEILWRDGVYTLKVFKSWAPMYAAISQDVSGLEVGRRYRLVAPIFPDVIGDFDGGKVAPERPDSGQVRLGASPVGAAWRDEGAIAYSGWWTGATVSPFYFTYVTFVHDFTATQTDMTVWIEFRSTYPCPNNGFFMDTMGLYTLDEVDTSVSNSAPAGGGAPAVSAGPTATPMPTPTPRADGAVVHVVQSGDTLWTIAIRYAETMGLTPEEALPAIVELNNNPAFINAGQELMIVPPGQAAPVEEEAPAEEEAAAEEETAVEEPTPEPTAVPVEEPVAETSPTSNAICVAAFNDADGNGQRDVVEGLMADAAISLFRGGSITATYVTDGINEPYCFENLEDDTYQVQIFPPADYVMTTTGSWAVAVSNGMSIAVEFGTKFDPNAGAVAVADAGAEATAVPEAADSAPEAEPETGGSNIGLIVLGAAVVLILLAGVGVFLLRQS